MIGDRGGTKWSVRFFERKKGNDKKVKVITFMRKHKIMGKKRANTKYKKETEYEKGKNLEMRKIRKKYSWNL